MTCFFIFKMHLKNQRPWMLLNLLSISPGVELTPRWLSPQNNQRTENPHLGFIAFWPMTQHTILWFVFVVYCGHFFPKPKKFPHSFCAYLNSIRYRSTPMASKLANSKKSHEQDRPNVWSGNPHQHFLGHRHHHSANPPLGYIASRPMLQHATHRLVFFPLTQKIPPHRFVLVCELHEVQRNHK